MENTKEIKEQGWLRMKRLTRITNNEIEKLRLKFSNRRSSFKTLATYTTIRYLPFVSYINYAIADYHNLLLSICIFNYVFISQTSDSSSWFRYSLVEYCLSIVLFNRS